MHRSIHIYKEVEVEVEASDLIEQLGKDAIADIARQAGLIHPGQAGLGDGDDSRTRNIIEAIDVLAHSPRIGRPVRAGKRELIIGRRERGYVCVYRYVEVIDTVFILAIRSQREAGYPSQPADS